MHRNLYHSIVNFFTISIKLKVATVLAFIHLILFIAFDLYYLLVISGESQDVLVWLLWVIIDFPISLLQFLALMLTSVVGGGEVTLNIFFILIHGWLGTLWWYFFPQKIWEWVVIIYNKIINVIR